MLLWVAGYDCQPPGRLAALLFIDFACPRTPLVVEGYSADISDYLAA